MSERTLTAAEHRAQLRRTVVWSLERQSELYAEMASLRNLEVTAAQRLKVLYGEDVDAGGAA